MPALDEKLKNFSAIVLSEANKQREQKLATLEEEKNKRIDEKETELLTEAYEEIQRSVIKSKRENSESVLKVEMEMKKDLIMQREKIIDNVFDAVRERLNAFTGSPEYKDWLLKRTMTAAAEVGEGRKEVLVKADDIIFKEFLENNVSGITVNSVDDGEDFIGGVIVTNTDKNICVNYSIKDMLNEKRGAFLQESGLSIY